MSKSKQTVVKLTDVETKILNELIDDARLSFRQIAHKVGVSTATVMKHVKSMENQGIIKKYTLEIGYGVIGYDVQVIMDVRIGKGQLHQVEGEIANHPNVEAVYDNTGPFDATIIAKFPSRATLDTFIKKVQSFDFVERTETKLLLNTVKQTPIKLPVKD